MTEQQTGAFFEAAVDLAKAGYPVFPIAPGAKRPTVEGGFYAATTEQTEIAEWILAGHGADNVAVATGVAGGSFVVVVEADGPEAYAWMSEHYGAPTVESAHEHAAGGHWYFQHPRDGKVVSRKVEDVPVSLDRKADGGYVLCPPSTGKAWTAGEVPEKAELPAPPTELRGPRKRDLFVSEESNGQPSPGRLLDAETMRRASEVIADHVRKVEQGRRHEHLVHLCGVLLSRHVHPRDASTILIDAWSEVSPELADRAPSEVSNTLSTTAAALEAGTATGVPHLEEITAGLFEDLSEVLRWRFRTAPADTNEHEKASGPADSSIYKEVRESASSTKSLALVKFAEMDAPPAREDVIVGLIPRYHPTTLYGWSGTSKSLIALLTTMSVAGGRSKLFGHDVKTHGPALYLDFELDADEQHRRVRQLALGMKMKVPDDLLYVSTLGFRTGEAVAFALEKCEEHEPVLVVLDSLGPAFVGDLNAAGDLIAFYNRYIAPFREKGATPLLVDHQARQQPGEGYQAKGVFGSSYKEHLSRSLIQVEPGDRSAKKGVLNVRIRHKKANFAALCEPFQVTFTFAGPKIAATSRNLKPSELATENTLNATDRVLAALQDGAAHPDELSDATVLARPTVKNAVGALKKAGLVEETGETRGQMKQVRLVETNPPPKDPDQDAGQDVGLFTEEF